MAPSRGYGQVSYCLDLISFPTFVGVDPHATTGSPPMMDVYLIYVDLVMQSICSCKQQRFTFNSYQFCDYAMFYLIDPMLLCDLRIS